jgi:tetratricopeptide (TPR) repeat protein
MALLRGEVSTARGLADRVVMLTAAENRVGGAFRSVVGGVLSAIESLRVGDLDGARVFLQPSLAEHQLPWLRLAAWTWQARVEARGGESENAEDAAVSAIEIARSLDPLAEQIVGCLFAELEAQDGATQPALDRLTMIRAAMEQLESKQGLAFAWLTRARILAAVQMPDECLAAARAAREIDPEWLDLTRFLARLALDREDLAQASSLLEQASQSAEARRELLTLRRVARGLPPWMLSELYRLREEPPSEELVGRLRSLAAFVPDLHEIGVVLGWKLLALQQHAAAAQVFGELRARSLDPELRASVELGLRGARHQERRLDAVRERSAADESPRPPSAFSGSLAALPFPDLLEFFRTTRRSGLLVVVAGETTGTVCLREGRLAGATTGTYRHLGERLCAAGHLALEQLAALSPEDHTGWLEVPAELVPEALVSASFAEQVRRAVGEMVGWTSGAFSFHPQQLCTGAPPETFASQEVLLQALGLDDEKREEERC